MIASARTAVLCVLFLSACSDPVESDSAARAAAASGKTSSSSDPGFGDRGSADAGSGGPVGESNNSDAGRAGSGGARSAADAGGSDSGPSAVSSTAGTGASAGSAGQIAFHEPTATKFVIRNDGDAALLLGSNCWGKWLDVSALGESFSIDEPCSCECGGTASIDCMCGFICRYTEKVLVPGESVTHSWDGHALDVTDPPTCHTKRVPEPGSELAARGCWNVYENQNLCDSVAFTYGSDTEVTLSAKATAPAPTRSRATLTNGTETPIQVVKERCGAPGWFELDMGEEFSLPGPCTCPCDDEFKASACPSCGACTNDVLQTLQPGASISFDWDGEFVHRYASGCSQRYAFPTGMQIVSKFCWTKPGDSEPTCHGGLSTVAQNVSFSAY